MLDLIQGNGSPPTDPQSVSGGLCFILKFRLVRIYSFGDSAIFKFWHLCMKLPIHAHFYGF